MSMFSQSQNVTIDGGTFDCIQGNKIICNTVIILGGLATHQSEQPIDEERWEDTISRVDAIIEKKIEQAKAVKLGAPSDDIQEELSALETEPSVEAVVISRRLIVHTGIDIAAKKLKTPVELVFTLTPASPTSAYGSWPTIVWKTLSFQPNTTMRRNLNWYSETGFCLVEEQNDGTLKPDINVKVLPKRMAVLQDVDEEGLDFSVQMDIPLETDIAIFNKSEAGRQIALCSIDHTKPETDRFSPVIAIPDLAPHEIRTFGPPVMLQAYAVSGYIERKPIQTSTISRVLFTEAGRPKPLDISTLKPVTSFRLYSHSSGRIVLERQ